MSNSLSDYALSNDVSSKTEVHDALEALSTSLSDYALSNAVSSATQLEQKFNTLSSGDEVQTALSEKANQNAFAPIFSELSTYYINDYVTYDGQLYRFLSNHIETSWIGTDAIVADLASPDATLDIESTNALRVMGADGTILWRQGYDSSTTASLALSNETVNYYEFEQNATSAVEISLPTAPAGKVADFILDVYNPPLLSTAAGFPSEFSSQSTYAVNDKVSYDGSIWVCVVEITAAGAWSGEDNWALAYPSISFGAGLDNTFKVVVPKDESLVDWLKIAPGETSEFYFTLTSFKLSNMPTYKVVKQTVEDGGAS